MGAAFGLFITSPKSETSLPFEVSLNCPQFLNRNLKISEDLIERRFSIR